MALRYAFLHRPEGLLCLLLVALLLLLLVAGPWLTPFDVAAQNVAQRLQSPSTTHWLGTDHLGRDLLSRVMVGTRVALGTALPAVTIALVIGVVLGTSAGYLGGWAESALLVVMDTLQAFPAVILALALLALIGPSTISVIVVVAIAFAPGYARVARAQVLALVAQPFVEAARIIGSTHLTIVLRHLLPNVLPALVILLAMDLPGVITFEAGLSFLGPGVKSPTPSWGVILAEGFDKIRTSPWPVVAAGAALMLSRLGFTLLGETLRDAFDPQVKQEK